MGSASMNLSNRRPAVAGTFYPADERKIERTLDEWFAPPIPLRQPWRAVMVPHAGWMYSGRIAARVLARVEFPSTVVILCPKHHAGGATCAVAPWGRWLFPGGNIEVDVELSLQLAAEVPGFQLNATKKPRVFIDPAMTKQRTLQDFLGDWSSRMEFL